MTLRRLIACTLLFLPGLLHAFTVDTLSFFSEILQEEREILLYIPDDYTTIDSVSCVYLLDGEFSNYRYAHIQNNINEVSYIGVGILHNDRKKELLAVNDAGHFLECIIKELIPLVEAKFTVQERILYGHSIAGSFSLYAFGNSVNIFDKFIASSPTPIMPFVNDEFIQLANANNTMPVKLYISYGENDMKQVRKWVIKFQNFLASSPLSHTDVFFEEHTGLNHNSVDIHTLKSGLLY